MAVSSSRSLKDERLTTVRSASDSPSPRGVGGEIVPATDIRLSPAIAEALVSELKDVIGDLENDHAGYLKAIREWWAWYEGTPATREKSWPWQGAPLSDDTEILLRRGWALVSEAKLGDEVLSRDPVTGEAAWMPVYGTIAQHFDNLIHFKSKSVDQLVSFGHKMCVERRPNEGDSQQFFVSAESLLERTSNHLLIPLTSKSWNGKPAVRLYGLDAGDVCEFVGWWVAEGWTFKSGTLGLGQSETANPEKCAHLEALFSRLGFTWSKRPSQYLIHKSSIPVGLWETLAFSGVAATKKIPVEFMDLSTTLLKRVLQGLVGGDGSISCARPHQNYDRWQYFTVSRTLAGQVQELCQKVGLRGTISVRKPRNGGTLQGRTIVGASDAFTVSINRKAHAKVGALKREIVPYGRVAYCVETPWHTILVRRNGVASWTGNSNIVIPVIRQVSDNIVARYFNQIHATGKMWVATSDNDDFKEAYLPGLIDFANAVAKNEMHVMETTLDWLNELVVIGESVLQLGWKQGSYSILDPKTGGLRTVSNGAYACLEHIPREEILWYRNVPIHLSECVVRESLFTAHEMRALGRALNLSREAVEKVLASPDEGESYAAYVRDGKRKNESTTNTKDSVWGTYSIREVYLTLPMLRAMGLDTKIDPTVVNPARADVKFVVTIHPKTSTLLRITPYPYYQEHWLFFQGYLRKRSGRGSGHGTAKMLEHHQRGLSTLANQSFDAVTRANAMWAKTSNPQLASTMFSLNRPIQVNEMGEFELLNAPKNLLPDMALFNALWQSAERVSGVNDPLLGRETRMGGHPSPATSTLALLGESNKLFAMGLAVIRTTLSRVGKCTLQLYQQFKVDPEKVVSYVGDDDAAQVLEWLAPIGDPIPGDLRFDLHAVSESMNPEVERQKAVLVNEMTANTYARMLQLAQVLDSPQATPTMKVVAKQAMEASVQGLKDFLNASQVDEIEKYVRALEGMQNGSLQGLQGILAQLGGAPGGAPGGVPPQGGGMGGPPGADALGGMGAPPPMALGGEAGEVG